MPEIYKPKIIVFGHAGEENGAVLDAATDALDEAGCEFDVFDTPRTAAEHLLGDVKGVIIPTFDVVGVSEPKKRKFTENDFVNKILDLSPHIALALITNEPEGAAKKTANRAIDTVLMTGVAREGILRWAESAHIAKPLPVPKIHPAYLPRPKLSMAS